MFFDVTTVPAKEKSEFGLLPKGWYRAMVTKSEGRDTRAGDGRMLALTFDLIDGPNKGRKIWCNYNVQNKNPEAVRIALSDLKALCEATNNNRPFEYEGDFHKAIVDKCLQIKLGHRHDNFKDEMVNNIVDYKPDGEATPTSAGTHISQAPNLDIPF